MNTPKEFVRFVGANALGLFLAHVASVAFDEALNLDDNDIGDDDWADSGLEFSNSHWEEDTFANPEDSLFYSSSNSHPFV